MDGGSGKRIPCSIVAAAAAIAVCWAASVFTTKKLQGDCGYAKPYLINYFHEAALGICCAPLAFCFRSARVGDASGQFAQQPVRFLAECWQLSGRACGLGLLSFASNCCFTTALRFTEASSAMTLEQLTSVFIAVLSCAFLGERYRVGQIAGLALAVAGGVATARADAVSARDIGSLPCLGDALVVATSALAAAYMVLFRKVFGDETLGMGTFFTFFVVKATFIVCVGWIGLVMPFEEDPLPENSCGWIYLLSNTFLQVVFNVGLAWAVVAVSPLAARLFILLGLPLAVVLDMFQGRGLRLWHAFGVLLALVGVATFELSSQPAPSRAEERSQCTSSLAQTREA